MIHRAAKTLEFAPIATASSRGWELTVDRAEGTGELSLEIDSPRIYLTHRIGDAAVIRRCVEFLAPPQRSGELPLGKLSSLSVSLLRDIETADRLVLLLGPRDDAALRYSIDGEDSEQFALAMRRLADLLDREPPAV